MIPINQRIADRARRPPAAGRRRRRAARREAPPSPSSPATARKRPAASTTRSCARSRSGWATCASSRSAAPRSSRASRSRASSRPNSTARSAPPTPRPGSRTSTCRTSRSGAPRRRSRARPGLEPLALALLRRPDAGARGGGGRVRRRREGRRRRRAGARGRALDPDRDASPRTPSWSAACASYLLGARATWTSTGGRGQGSRKASSSPTTSPPASRQRSPVPSRAGAVARAQRGRSSRVTVALPEAERRRAGPSEPERRIAGALRHRRPGARRRRLAGGDRALGVARQADGAPLDRGRAAAARAGRGGGDPRVRRATCATCCWRPRPGQRVTMGLDPGLRTGVKVAVVDGTGKLLDTATIYPHAAAQRLGRLAAHARRALRQARRRS